jgi:hypothetical protein
MLTNNHNINLNSKVTISGKWLESIGNNLNKIHNDHWDLLNLVKYVNTLIELQVKSRRGKIVFVNSLGPWSNNYFEYKNIQLPSDLDPYVQKLLDDPYSVCRVWRNPRNTLVEFIQLVEKTTS